jgi:hypothetical protein
MSRARKRKQPEDVTYIDILRAKGKLPGWDLEPISSLRITNMTLMPLTPNASEAVRKAREYFYLWVKRDHWYPHMLCRTPEPLRLLIMGIYGLKGIILTTSRVDAFVEPISGYVHHGSRFPCSHQDRGGMLLCFTWSKLRLKTMSGFFFILKLWTFLRKIGNLFFLGFSFFLTWLCGSH